MWGVAGCIDLACFTLNVRPRLGEDPDVSERVQRNQCLDGRQRFLTTPPTVNAVRRQGGIHIIVGVLLLSAAIAGLKMDIEWLAQPFYAWAWWGYILLLDGYSACKRQDSILSTRRRFILPICLWSVTFWFFFELVNARIRNWYYVGVFPFGAWFSSSLFAVAAFATVFMGIFQTMDALNASGLWRGWRRVPRQMPWHWTYGLQIAGLSFATLALVFPYYLAPLVWGSFTLLVDPWNYRRGARSLLRDLEQGDYGLVARLLLAGLICGVVWESLNFFAPQKWIYTVRGLEGFKLFEMPLIGFLGFPALALDCMAAYGLFSSWLLGNRTWERPEDLVYTPALRPQQSKSLFRGTAIVQLVFCAFVSAFATPVNVASFQVELRDLGLTVPEVRHLNEQGIARPRQFLAATDTSTKLMRLRTALGWSPNRLNEIRERAALYMFKGIGTDHGRMLEALGVRTLQDLATCEPEALLRRLSRFQPPALVAAPRLDFIKVWVHDARKRNVQRVR